MTTWAFCDETGEIQERRFVGSERLAKLNARGLTLIEGGELNPLSQRVDVEALAAAGKNANPADFVVTRPDAAERLLGRQVELVARRAMTDHQRVRQLLSDLEAADRMMQQGELSSAEMATLQKFRVR
jgi:hypothetical protein